MFTVGALLMLFGASKRNDLAVPGALSSHHAQVLARTGVSERCATCHPGSNQGLGGWLANAWSGSAIDKDDAHSTQSQLCLDCHQDLTTPGAEPLLAHGLPSASLRSKTSGNASRTNAVFAAVSPWGATALGTAHGNELACAACHQEHHGADHDLAALTDARCQACHTERFDRFATDHPDFGVWPTVRRTRIAFNHASHSVEHFTKANREFDCRSCHLADATGDLTVRPTYQATCAECHDADLARSFGDGLAFISLPSIDADALVDPSDAAFDWPQQARNDFDGEVPTFTKLLLAADRDASQAIHHLGADFSFFDIDPTDAADLEAARVLVRAFQRLFDDLQEEGHGAIAARLRTLLGEPTGQEADYVGRLPPELIDRLQATWLGNKTPPEPFDAIEDRSSGGGWLIDDERLTLAYRPTGHDDPLVRAWLDAIVALPADLTPLRDACLAEFTRPGAAGGCFECHSLEHNRQGELLVNWSGRNRLAEPASFTRFSHRPHVLQPELADCSTCHAIDPTSSPATTYTGWDPSQFASEFVALGKSACVQCHQPHAAGDACTQCHNYHVSPAALARDFADSARAAEDSDRAIRTSSDTQSERR